MKDEIKEFNEEMYVEMIEDGTLYDYITNLQEELKETVDLCSKHFVKIQTLKTNMKELQQENEKVHKDFGELSERYFFTKSRCEKAIEDIDLLMQGRYLKDNIGYMKQPCCNARLEIIKKDLQGSDKE